MQLTPLPPNPSSSPLQGSAHSASDTLPDSVKKPAELNKGDVQLSAEGLARLRSEQSTQQADTAGESGLEMAKIDKLIQQLQKQIQELQAQLQALEGESSEGAEKQREGLRQQLNQLMGALQDAFNQKIKLLEQELGG